MAHAPREQDRSREQHAALVERVMRGDSCAEDELIALFQAGLLVMFRARTGEPEAARDLTQDTLIAIVRALRDGRLRDVTRLAEFTHGIARNVANNYVRARRRHPTSRVSDRAAANDGNDPVELSERRRVICRALAAMTPADRRIVLLTLIHGLKPREIAAQLGLGRDVVRARKSRALRRFLDRLRSFP